MARRYAAEAVYHHACAAKDPEALELQDYLAKRPSMPNGDPVGFEVICDEDEMLAWLATNRPEIHASLAGEAATPTI